MNDKEVKEMLDDMKSISKALLEDDEFFELNAKIARRMDDALALQGFNTTDARTAITVALLGKR